MSKVLIAVFASLSLFASASAQTSLELADRYKHHEVYEVQPGIQMRAKYASNGLVCQMEIEQTRFSNKGVDLTGGIEQNRVSALIDELVPPSERGERTPSHAGGTVTGQVIESIQSYSNVTVRVISSHGTNVIAINWLHRTCEP